VPLTFFSGRDVFFLSLTSLLGNVSVVCRQLICSTQLSKGQGLAWAPKPQVLPQLRLTFPHCRVPRFRSDAAQPFLVRLCCPRVFFAPPPPFSFPTNMGNVPAALSSPFLSDPVKPTSFLSQSFPAPHLVRPETSCRRERENVPSPPWLRHKFLTNGLVNVFPFVLSKACVFKESDQQITILPSFTVFCDHLIVPCKLDLALLLPSRTYTFWFNG